MRRRRFFSIVGIASQEAIYSARAAELIANLYRELRRPPPGCLERDAAKALGSLD